MGFMGFFSQECKFVNDHLLGKDLFIRFTMRVFCKHLSVCVCASFPFGSEGGMWDLIA